MDSRKGYQYESSRLRKVFLFSEEKVANICNNISICLFREKVDFDISQRVLIETPLMEFVDLIGLKAIVFDEEKIRITRETISNIITENPTSLVNEKPTVEYLQNYFGLNEDDVSEIIFSSVNQIFQKKVIDVLETIYNSPDGKEIENCIEELNTSSKELIITEPQVEKIFIDSMNTTILKIFEQILMCSRSKKNDLGVESIDKLLFLEKSSNVFEKIRGISSQKVFSNCLKNVLSTKQKSELESIIRFYIKSFSNDLNNLRVNDQKVKKLSEVLGIESEDLAVLYQESESPMYKKAIQDLVNDELDTENVSMKIKDIEKNFNLTEKAFEIVKISLYRESLEQMIGDGVILKNEDLEYLNNLKLALSLKWDDVQKVHDILYEPVFKKSVQEAMGATGIIPSNYWDGLEKLRVRLQLTENKAKSIFHTAVQDKLKQIFEKILFETENPNSKTETGKDNGEDPTIKPGSGTALGIEAGDGNSNELFNMVDIYFRNNIFNEETKEKGDAKQTILKGISGRSESKKTVKSSVKVLYPVSLKGMIDTKKAGDVYKKYVIDCFSAKTQSEKRRLFNKLDSLGPILGLTENDVQSIHSGVGEIIYKRYLGQALKKGYLDNQDNTFLSSIQSTLSMNPVKSSQIIKESKKGVVSLEVERVFASPKVDPKKVTQVRLMAEQFNINLTEDIGVSLEQRSRMFRVELDSAISEGSISFNNQEKIVSIQNSFGIPEMEAKKILLNCINTRSEEHLVNAVASLRRSSNEEVLVELEKMLSFGQLLPVTINTNFGSDTEKENLIQIYESYSDSTNKIEKQNLLKKMLDL
jgi:hypothetical protein